MTTKKQPIENENRLFRIAIDWLKTVERREFYQKVVEVSASLLDSEVCALFVETNKIGDKNRMCLVAGKLPPGHSAGTRMNPAEVGPNPEDHSYEITPEPFPPDVKFDGITGEIASTGKPIYKNGGWVEITSDKSHVGRWDKYVWENNPNKKFKNVLGVPIKNGTNIIGVIKVENKNNGEYGKDDVWILEQIGQSLSQSLVELKMEGRELKPEIEENEYRVPRSTPKSFEKRKTGEVVIRHSMTAICQSDIYYYLHEKSRKKLDDRLPLVLGHETTGEVYQLVGEHKYKYKDNERITPKDKVVVIPLIPCGTCEICEGDFGENYCPSSRFMASNESGSLRSLYKYHPNLILKIDKDEYEKYALFTEPMSNVVQILNELGFKEEEDKVVLDSSSQKTQKFDYFHVHGESFSNIFDTITAEEPWPRTIFELRNPHNSKLGFYKIRHQNLMTKGLGLLGVSINTKDNVDNVFRKNIENPKVLILGGGTIGYILAILLSCIFKIAKDRIIVTGREGRKLNIFRKLCERFTVGPYLNTDGSYDYKKNIIEDLCNCGNPSKYDVVFECVGGNAVEKNINLAMKVLKEGGIIAMEGLTDKIINLDFDTLINKELFVKGFYRGSIEAYAKSLNYIQEHKSIRDFLGSLIDDQVKIRGISGFHKVEDQFHLSEIFEAANTKTTFGRVIINQLE